MAVVVPLQYTLLLTGLTTGVGLTSTVAVIGVPAQPPVVGVMVKVTVTGNGLVLVKVPLILPEPLAAIPLTVALLFLVQLNTVPGILPVSTIVVIAEPEQMVWLAGVATALGVGLTSTVAVMGAPPQLLAVGVMVKVTSTGARVVLVSVPLILPVPLPGMPVTVPVLFLVQLYVVPLTVLVNTIVVIGTPEHTVCDAGVAVATGVGLTTTVAVMDGPVQVTPPLVKLGVMVKVTVMGADVVLVSVPVMFPAPLAAIPVTVTVLFLVQVKVVPTTLPDNMIGVMATPEQAAWLAGVATALGIGFTSTVAVIAGPAQPLADGIMVKVTSSGAVDVTTLVSVPLIGLPDPLAGIPVTATTLSLVQV